MDINFKLILLAIFIVVIPVFLIVDSVFLKWIKVSIHGDTISIRRLFRRRKRYNLSTELFTWKRIQGYSKHGGNGYTLIMRFKNGDSYQVDSSYSLESYKNVYRTLELKFKDLLEK